MAARTGRNASLHVYYGFTEHDRQLASKDAAYASWMHEMQQALLRAAPLGVTQSKASSKVKLGVQ